MPTVNIPEELTFQSLRLWKTVIETKKASKVKEICQYNLICLKLEKHKKAFRDIKVVQKKNEQSRHTTHLQIEKQ